MRALLYQPNSNSVVFLSVDLTEDGGEDHTVDRNQKELNGNIEGNYVQVIVE